MSRASATPPQQDRAKYEPPRITVYGNVRDITRSMSRNSSRANDGGGGGPLRNTA